MTREEKIQKARELRDKGKSYREIANRVGVTSSCVAKWLNPERAKKWNRNQNAGRNEYKRQIARTAGRARCEGCGCPLGEGSKWNGSSLCRPCHRQRVGEARDRRRADIEALFNDGLTAEEIADHIGSTAKAVGSEITLIRRDGGYDLPYRRNESSPRYPEQVAS